MHYNDRMKHRLKTKLAQLIPIFLLIKLDAVETFKANQYDNFADKYSNIFLEKNQKSITAYFKQFDFSLKDQQILDLGCGDGHDLSLFKAKGAKIFGIDASEEMIRLSRMKNPEADIRLGYFDKIPFSDHIFDIVVSKWALQTAINIEPIYHEIARVMKPGGKLIF